MRRQLSRDLVVDAARAMVVDEGLDGVTLRRLAASLGVTAPALYAYVADKEDLLRAIAEQQFERLIERFEAIDADDPLERVRTLAAEYVRFAGEDPELFRVMFLFPPELLPDMRTGRELPLATKAFGIAAAAVEEAIAGGQLAHPDPLLAALTLWTGAHGVASVSQLGFGAAPEMESALLSSVIDAILAGLGSTPR